jgi:cob(I)alamin adenosyltransferase
MDELRGAQMAMEFDMITTRGGDGGKSGLFGGERRFKSEQVFSVLGDIDELVSFLGMVRTLARDPAFARDAADTELREIQKALQDISAVIATPVSSINKIKPLGKTDEQWTSYLVKLLDRLEEIEKSYIGAISLNGFIIPGSNELSARFDVARTICRRAERQMVDYIRNLSTDYLRLAQNYLNRLSDCLFVYARHIEQAGS